MRKIFYSVLALALFCAPLGLVAQEYEDSAAITFMVLKDTNGKPVRNASVIMHPVKKNGQQERGGLQLKSDGEGRCYFDGVPYGKLRVQVLAGGYQTFGQDYNIAEPKMTITIKLKRPQEQYSIYSDSQNSKKDEAPETKSPDAKNTDKPAPQNETPKNQPNPETKP